MKIKVKPEYRPLVQMRWCCLPCSVLWIIFRRGFWVDQEKIAKELKTRVLKKHLNFFSEKMLVAKKIGDAGAPDIIGKDAYLVNNFFRKYKIPLVMETFKIGKVKEPKKFIAENLKKGNDVMLSFNWTGLGKRKKNYGHVVTVSEIDTKNNLVTLGDPSQGGPKFWKIKIDKLTKAMSPKYDGTERGFYIFIERH